MQAWEEKYYAIQEAREEALEEGETLGKALGKAAACVDSVEAFEQQM